MAAAVGLRELSVRGGGEAPGVAGSFEHGAGCAEEFECLLREALPRAVENKRLRSISSTSTRSGLAAGPQPTTAPTHPTSPPFSVPCPTHTPHPLLGRCDTRASARALPPDAPLPAPPLALPSCHSPAVQPPLPRPVSALPSRVNALAPPPPPSLPSPSCAGPVGPPAGFRPRLSLRNSPRAPPPHNSGACSLAHRGQVMDAAGDLHAFLCACLLVCHACLAFDCFVPDFYNLRLIYTKRCLATLGRSKVYDLVATHKFST
jgi:hypothetical protein